MSEEMNVGGIVATVRLDSGDTDRKVDKIVNKINSFGSALESTLSAADKMRTQTNALSPTMDKYDAKLTKLNAEYAQQNALVEKLGARLDDLADDFFKAAKAVGEADSFDPAKIFPAESAELDKEFAKLQEIEAKIKEVSAAREKAAAVAVSSAAKQSKASGSAATALKTEANAAKITNMVFDTGVTALRAVTSAAGGTVSQLGYLGTELMNLKRNMQAAATTGAMMASVMSFGVMAAVTLVSAGISALREKEEKRRQAFEEGVENLKDYAEQLRILKKNHDALIDSKSTTDRLTEARDKLTSTFDNLIVGYTEEGRAILANNEVLEREIELLNKKADLQRKQILANSDEILPSDYLQSLKELQAWYENYDVYKNNEKYCYNWFTEWISGIKKVDERIEESSKKIKVFEERANAYLELNFEMRDNNGKLIKTWNDLSSAEEAVANSLKLDIFEKFKDGVFSGFEEAQGYLNKMMSDESYVSKYYQSIEAQTGNQAEAVKALKSAYEELNSSIESAMSGMSGIRSDMSAALAELNENGKLSRSTVNSLISSYPQLIDYLNAETGQLNLTEEVMRDLYEIQKQLRIAELEGAKAKLQQNEERIKSNYDVARSELAAAQAALMTSGTSDWKINRYYEKSSAFKEAENELKELRTSCDRIDTLIQSMENTELDLSVSANTSKAAKSVSEYSAALERLNHQKRMGQLSTKEEISALDELGRKYSLTAEEQADWEYRLYAAKKQYNEETEAARTRALRERYSQIENLKALGKLNSEQELKQLEQIRTKYKLNADERIALEIKIYNLKKQLRQSEMSALDDLGEAITEALQNQYEQQRKAETKRINESIAAWEQWEKSTVEAIQAETDALDKLEKEQESQAAAAEYYRKSQELKLKIAYEKDDYQRKQLEKELNRLSQEEQKRLQKEQLEAQKAELQSKIENVKSIAEERKKGLEAELEVINDNYDRLTSALSLRAQTEQIIMQQSQENIIAMIKSYAPDYGLAGQSIGESLYNGFKSKVDNIFGYVESVLRAIENYQASAKAAAIKAAEDFEASYQAVQASANEKVIVVNYTSNFNTPVQSPVQTKRAIESTAANLAAVIK